MSTNRIGIIIQGTLSGLTNLVVSPNMATLLESPVVKPSLLDERNEIAQFARNTNVYSLENNAQLNIFSIILTDKLDSFKRAGYVAIRLYFPNGVVSQEPIVQVLNQLKEKYEEIAKNNTGNFDMYANQFLEIVAAIQTTNVTPTPNLGMQKKACFGFDVNTENVYQKIQTLTATSYFSKIYGVPVNLLGNLTLNGYIDISNVIFHKLTINGMFQLVQSVTVNNQSIAFDKNNFSLALNVLPSDQILINYKDGRKEQVPPQKGFHNITQKPLKGVGPSKKDNSKINLLFIGGLVVVLSLALYIFWPKDTIKEPKIEKPAQAEEVVKEKVQTTYTMIDDVLECNVPLENQKDTIIKFCIWGNKIAYKQTEKLKFNDENKLEKVYKEFDLNDSIINSYLSKLIKPENTSKTEVKQNTQTINQRNPTIPVKSKSPVAGKTETRSAEID